ncbi:MAG TPA: hypothetical protein VFR17_02110 [Mycobacterium sp.]|nr:hypothetical protein [Mycobacterium sp.]
MAAGGAIAAALIGLGAAGLAHADQIVVTDPSPEPDGYTDLFGGGGNLPQTADDVSLNEQLFANNPGAATAFDLSVDNFQSQAGDHPITNLINGLDPSAFAIEHDPDIVGTLQGGGFLVPDDFLGYLAVDLDYFLLTPTALAPALLGPVIDTLAGSPPF